jgi:hypothetical protein
MKPVARLHGLPMVPPGQNGEPLRVDPSRTSPVAITSRAGLSGDHLRTEHDLLAAWLGGRGCTRVARVVLVAAARPQKEDAHQDHDQRSAQASPSSSDDRGRATMVLERDGRKGAS